MMDEQMIELAMKLECEMPYDTVSKMLRHTGWLDLLETMKQLSPTAYDALAYDLLPHEEKAQR
jgi:hypothetical protein